MKNAINVHRYFCAVSRWVFLSYLLPFAADVCSLVSLAKYSVIKQIDKFVSSDA